MSRLIWGLGTRRGLASGQVDRFRQGMAQNSPMSTAETAVGIVLRDFAPICVDRGKTVQDIILVRDFI